MIGPKKLDEVVEKASVAFWKEAATQLPDLNAEFLSHGTVLTLQIFMKDALERWSREHIESTEQAQEDSKPKPRRDRYGQVEERNGNHG